MGSSEQIGRESEIRDMAREKAKGMKLPANPLALLKAISSAEEKSTAEFKLSLFIDRSLDPALVAYAKKAFRPTTENLSLEVIPYDEDHVEFSPGSELVIIMAAQAPITGRLLNRAFREQLPAVVVTLDPVGLQKIAREYFNEIDAGSIVTSADNTDKEERFSRLFKELGSWIVRNFPEGLLPMARALPFVREPFVQNAIQITSLQNAAIAAVFFLPGADMPLLTLNQVKLFLQIAAAYDAELDKKRMIELLALSLGGLGFRALARRLVVLLPVFGWAVRGSVGYGGTLAIGKVAQQYFERGGDIKSIYKGMKKPSQTEALQGKD